MVTEIKRRDSSAAVYYESSHSALIFRIKKRLPKLRTPMLQLPDGPDAKRKFIDAVKLEIQNSVGDKLETV
jgi:hypothetical protein